MLIYNLFWGVGKRLVVGNFTHRERGFPLFPHLYFSLLPKKWIFLWRPKHLIQNAFKDFLISGHADRKLWAFMVGMRLSYASGIDWPRPLASSSRRDGRPGHPLSRVNIIHQCIIAMIRNTRKYWAKTNSVTQNQTTVAIFALALHWIAAFLNCHGTLGV